MYDSFRNCKLFVNYFRKDVWERKMLQENLFVEYLFNRIFERALVTKSGR